MDKIKKIITSPLFMALLSGLVGGLLLADGNDMYGGISIGIGIVLFLNAFKTL